jgi:hypothetical protein
MIRQIGQRVKVFEAVDRKDLENQINEFLKILDNDSGGIWIETWPLSCVGWKVLLKYAISKDFPEKEEK